MRIVPLHRSDDTDYSCTCYWVLGENNAPDNLNTLVDTGSTDPGNLPFFLHAMTQQAKGIGKQAVEQVILTHAHFDHMGGLPGIEAQFSPMVYSWLPMGKKHHPIYDGCHLMVGDQGAKLLHTPGHSEDSICIYLAESGTLFSGDSLYRITDHLGVYPASYLRTLERLATLNIRAIYPGHGIPILKDALKFVEECLENVRQSLIRD